MNERDQIIRALATDDEHELVNGASISAAVSLETRRLADVLSLLEDEGLVQSFRAMGVQIPDSRLTYCGRERAYQLGYRAASPVADAASLLRSLRSDSSPRDGNALLREFGWNERRLDDACRVLEANALIKTRRPLGAAPASVELTPRGRLLES